MTVLKTERSTAEKRTGRLSSLVVRRAVDDDLERVVRLADSLQDSAAPSLRDELARHFAVQWRSGNDPGNVLVHGQDVVGFLASLTHTRHIEGQPHTICNMASWYVSPAHRRGSMTLVRESLRRTDVTYTAVSPIARVAKIIVRFGFEELETHRRIIYPTLSFRPVRPRASITVGDVSSLLSTEQLKIYQDHVDLPCEHAVLERDGRQCYMVLVRKSRRFNSAARIDYLSDRALFNSCIPHVAGQLCRKLRVTSLSIHDRFLGDTKIPFSKRKRLRVPQMFRSNSLTAADIDNLYTECVLMGF
jgi:hypothetical protein